MMFEKPKIILSEGEITDLEKGSRICPKGEYAEFISELCAKKGMPCGGEGNIIVTAEHNNSREMTYIDETRRLTDEKFKVEAEKTANGLNINISFGGMRAFYYALCGLFRRIKSGFVLTGEFIDYPLFGRRGYIEGFYGTPWSFEERASMLRLMSEHGMNTYYYAPKDDEYHRDKWSELYPDDRLDEVIRIKNLADECFVDLHFCIAPGLSIKYSDEGHFNLLMAKFRQLYDVGIRNFGLLLDDIPENLQYHDDIEKFGETVNAHIYLANRVYDEMKSLDRDIKLTVCPRQYHGRGDEYFISKLGSGIEPDISLFWTGRNICSQELTVIEAVRFIESTRHRPLYWDNFPVNDAEMMNEMHLGYIDGREPELYRYSEGIISNCMEYCECSKIPLLTVADYLWNPTSYDHESSWEYALKVVVGEQYDSFRYFADHLLTSCLKSENSRLMSAAFSATREQLYKGDAAKACELFSEYAGKVSECADMIKKNGDRRLFMELSRWSKKFLLCSEILRLCSRLMSGETELKDEIREKYEAYMNMPEILTDFCFREAVELLLKM
jgi:hyaluronoglucosaminidase